MSKPHTLRTLVDRDWLIQVATDLGATNAPDLSNAQLTSTVGILAANLRSTIKVSS